MIRSNYNIFWIFRGNVWYHNFFIELLIVSLTYFMSCTLYILLKKWDSVSVKPIGELGPSSFIEVKQTSSLLRALWGAHPTILEPDELLSYTKRCLNRWSRYTPPKFKWDKSNSNYFVEESKHICARTLFVLFERFI